MLRALLQHKVSLLGRPEDSFWRRTLEAVLSAPPEPKEGWQRPGTELLFRIRTRIAAEEGVSPLEERPSEALFRHHLPDFVTGCLQALERILLAGGDPGASPEEEQLTAAHLLLKVVEWLVWNYEDRCVYGPDAEEKARGYLDAARFGAEVWGDRDEVWLTLLEVAADALGLDPSRLPLKRQAVACRGYGLLIPGLSGRASSPEAWTAGRVPEDIGIILAVARSVVDQAVVRVSLLDLGPGGAKPSGWLEGQILSRVAELTGTPEETSHTLQ